MNSSIKFKVYGTRGSSPVSGKSVEHFGGETSCFTFETPSGLLVIDAGSGMMRLAQDLEKREHLPPITILFTHFHLDHLIGLPSFSMLHKPGVKVDVMGDSVLFPAWEKTLNTLMQEPLWPVDFKSLVADVNVKNLPKDKKSIDLYGMNVSWCAVQHPQGCLAYRISVGDKSIVLATDREYAQDEDAVFVPFAKNTDVLIHDAQYTPEEYPEYKGWGHSTWEHAIDLREKVGAKKLLLTSHAPFRDDAAVRSIVELARASYKNTEAVYTGMEFEL